jgi:hypothetical protein
MKEVEVGGKRGVVMLLRLRWRHQCLLRLWRHQCRLWLWWRHQRRLLLQLRLRLVVLEGVEVVVGLRGRHEPTIRVAVLLLLRVVVIHLPLATPSRQNNTCIHLQLLLDQIRFLS